MACSIIAEIGNTHEGSVGLAKRFIHAASECGVHAVKFQTHIFSAESLPNAPNPPYFSGESRKGYFERTAFSLAQYRELKDYAEQCGCEFLSSPFSVEAVDLLEQLDVATYKIPSGEVTNLLLLERIAHTKKRVLLSSGMSTWSELDEAVEILQSSGCKELILLQCTSEYPCKPEDAGLNVLDELKNRYGLPVGYSDHTLGLAVPIAAVIKGATIIEKHFTLSKLMYGSDAKNSTEPEEFARLVREIRAVETALSSKVCKDEKAGDLSHMKNIFEKSIVSIVDIPQGSVLEAHMLAVKKPGSGISPRHYKQILGKRAKNTIPKDTALTEEQIEGFSG